MNGQSIAENSSRAWIDVDLGALLRNAAALSRQARKPLCPMVKADAYGLGALPVVRALESLQPWGYGVATVAEGRELRDAGVSRPVIVFTPPLPGVFAELRVARLTPALGDAAGIAAWGAGGGGEWHLAIDTGMSRAGARWDTLGSLATLLVRHPPAGAFTHFHSSELEDGSMAVQEQRFRAALATLPALPPLLHTENSGAIARTSPSPWSFVRPGVFLYGVGSGAPVVPEPVVTMRAPVVDLREVRGGESVSYDATWKASRDTRVATLAAGYADGYRRSLGNVGSVLVRGSRVPVVGTVTMDMTMIDVTGVPCDRGDAATLIGRDGGELITVEDVGRACALSPYEVLTGLRQRIERRYRP